LFFLQESKTLFLQTRNNVYKSRHTYRERRNLYVLLMLLSKKFSYTRSSDSTQCTGLAKAKNEQIFVFGTAVKIQKNKKLYDIP